MPFKNISFGSVGMLRSLCRNDCPHFNRQYAGMLPGITSKLVKVLQGATVKSTKATVAVLDTWTAFATAIMDDSNDNLDLGFINQALFTHNHTIFIAINLQTGLQLFSM